MIIENVLRYIEKLKKGPVGNGVIHIAARFPSDHNIAHSQYRKLLRDVGWFNLQSFAELIHPFLAAAKAVENPNSDRVRERLEELRLEVGNLLWHCDFPVPRYSNLRILLCQSVLSPNVGTYMETHQCLSKRL